MNDKLLNPSDSNNTRGCLHLRTLYFFLFIDLQNEFRGVVFGSSFGVQLQCNCKVPVREESTEGKQ